MSQFERKEIFKIVSYFNRDSIVNVGLMKEFLEQVKKEGMDDDGIVDLIEAMVNTGKKVSWETTKLANQTRIDQPSTGGSGNKSPLIVPPILAAGGLFVPKMSTTGSVAGTIDILRTIGYKTELNVDEFVTNVNRNGLSTISQTEELVPVDKKMIELRRKTGTMRCEPLVISSILSKKLALGCTHLVIDVKAGSESKFGDIEATIDGAKRFVDIGEKLGIKVACILTENDLPQGKYLGRALSLIEVEDVLNGRGPKDQKEICLGLAAQSFLISSKVNSIEDGLIYAESLIKNGSAYGKFKSQLENQGSNVERISKIKTLAQNLREFSVLAKATGYVYDIRANLIEEGMKKLLESSDGKTIENIDSSWGCSNKYSDYVGIIIGKQVSEMVEKGEVLARVYSDDSETGEKVAHDLQEKAFILSNEEPKVKHILAIVDEKGIHKSWERESEAAYAIIKAKINNEDRFLLQLNKHRNTFNFVSGHYEKEKDRGSFDNTVVREIEEELEPLKYESDFEVSLFLDKPLEKIAYSDRFDQWTKYKFLVYQMNFLKPIESYSYLWSHDSKNKWFTLKELHEGISKEGDKVTRFPVLSILYELGLTY